MGCLNCGKELVHTPGKRPKKFCSNSCRSSYSQKKKKGKEGEPKRGPGRPVFKSRIIALSGEPVIQPEKPFPQKEDETVRVFREDGSEILPIHNESIHFKKGTFIIDNEKNPNLYAAAIVFSSPAPEVFDAPLSNTIQDEHPKYFIPANQAVIDKHGQTFPVDPQELLRMAKNGVSDVEAFKKHVSAIKMTRGQRDMIYSKLKS